MQPTNPDDNPTQPIDDSWSQPRPDTVDSAAPPAGPAPGRRGLRLVGVAGAVLALVAAGAFGALLAGGSGGGAGSAALTGAGSSTDDGADDGSGEGGTGEDDGTAGDRRKGLGHGMLGHGRGGPGRLGGGMIGGGMPGGPFGRGLHGSFVVEDPDGGYRTVLTQQGTATAVSDSSITVKSADGFVATYRLTDESMVMTGPEGTDSITEGADVAVTALETGSSARAVHVVDLSQVRERFEHHFKGGPGSPDDDDDSPTPDSSATSGASV